MEIRKLFYAGGAEKAEGLAVIIDVFRAFSTACYIFGSGAGKVILAESEDEAFRIKRQNPQSVLIGERGGKIIRGFDLGNSPFAVKKLDLSARTAVLTTSAGTRGVLAAKKADEVITGSFVNAGAVIEYILMKKPEELSLVCMGWNASEPADEDNMCADYIKSVLEDAPKNFKETADYLRRESATESFLDLREELSAPGEDFELCLELDRFDFVLRAAGRELIGVYPSKTSAAS